jgi:triacylglycerol lipase
MEGLNLNREIMLYLFVVLSPLLFSGFFGNTVEGLIIDHEQNPILFIHGRGGDITNWDDMITRFKEDGWSNSSLYAYNFQNSVICTEQQNINNANQIKQWVDNILSSTGAQKVDIVAHSMGGISSRYYIKFIADHNKIDDYVTLGSPHHGSPTQKCVYSYDTPTSFMIELNEGDETPGGILNDVIGDRNDPFLGVTYNGTHIPGNISYVSIFSSDDAIVYPHNTSYLEGAQNLLVSSLSHTEIVTTELAYDLVSEAVKDEYLTTITTRSSTNTFTTESTDTSQKQTSGVTPLIIILSLVVIPVTRKIEK